MAVKPARQVSPRGIAVLKGLEAVGGKAELKAYLDDAGVWTIGFGHTGPEVVKGYTITPQQAEIDLDNDLDKVEFAICKHVQHRDLNDNQFDALAMLLFNAGVGVLFAKNFSAAIKPDPATGKIRLGDVAAQFPKWVWITDRRTGVKRKSQGLINRRAAELTVWNTPVAVEVKPRTSDDTVVPRIYQVQPPKPAVKDLLGARVVAEPTVEAPLHTSSTTPEPPPATVAATPGGKSFLTTVGGVIVVALTSGYDQVLAVATQISKINAGVADMGTWAHAGAAVVCVGIVGVSLYTYWVRHKDVQKKAG